MVIAFDPWAPIGALNLIRLAASGGGGGGASAGDVRAGGAFVEIFTKDNRLVSGLESARRRLSSFGASMVGIGARIGAIGGAALAPLAGLFAGGLDRANKLKDLQDAFSLTAETTSKLGYAAEVAGLSMEDLNTVLFKLGKDFETDDVGGLFLDMVEQLSEIENPSQRAQRAFELFGKQGKALLPVLGDIKNLLGEAPIVDQETLDNAEQFEQETKKIGIALTSALLPALRFLTPLLQGIGDLVRENASALLTVGAVAGGLVAAGLALAGLGVAASAAAAGLGVLAAVLKGIGLAVGFVLSPLGLFLAAAVGLGVAFVTLTDSGRMLGAWVVGGLADAFAFLKDTFLTTWGGIKDALMSGDLRLAGEIAVAGLTVVWRGFVLEITKLWNGFKGFFVDAWHDAVMLGKLALVDFAEFAKKQLGESFGPFVKIAALTAGIAGAPIGKGADLAAIVAMAGARAGDPEAAKQDILNSARKEQEARDAARKADADTARKELNAAKDELQRLRDQAARGREKAPAERAAARIEAVAGALARGAFGAGNLGPGFFAAGGGIPKQQLDEQKRTTAAAIDTKAAVEKLAEKMGFAL